MGVFPPGMRIVERELAELLKIGRLPVRDTLVDLEHKGQIVVRGNGRCVINLERFDG
jgi:DNA-binding GntR family transcriptional regulator